MTCDGKTEELTNQWKYYINMLYNMDDFMREYTEALDATGEPRWSSSSAIIFPPWD